MKHDKYHFQSATVKELREELSKTKDKLAESENSRESQVSYSRCSLAISL